MSFSRLLPLFVICLALLSACGSSGGSGESNAAGGGGGSGTAPIPPPPPVALIALATPSSSGTYSTGDAIDINVKFSAPVTVTGVPTLQLNTREQVADSADSMLSTPALARYKSGSGSSTLTFHYVIQAADRSSHLDYVDAGSLDLNGGTLRDYSNRDVATTLPAAGATGSLGQSGNIQIKNWSAVSTLSAITPVYPSVSPQTFSNALGDSITLQYIPVSGAAGGIWASMHNHLTNIDTLPTLIAQLAPADWVDGFRAMITDEGTALVFWTIRSYSTFTTLYTCTYRTSGNCTGLLAVGNFPSGLSNANSMHLSPERQNTVNLLWSGNGLQTRSYSTLTNSWTAATTLTPADDPMFGAVYYQDASGNETVVWPESSKLYHIEALRMNAATGVWTQNELDGYGESLQLVGDASGNLTVIWDERTSDPKLGGMGRVTGAYFAAATATWYPKTYVSSGPFSTGFIFKTLVQSGNAIMAVWCQDTAVLVSFFNPASNTWSVPQTASSGIAAYGVAAVIDAGGNIGLVFASQASPATPPTIIYGSYFSQQAGVWGAPVKMTSEGSLTFFDGMSAASDGSLSALFKQNTNAGTITSLAAYFH